MCCSHELIKPGRHSSGRLEMWLSWSLLVFAGLWPPHTPLLLIILLLVQDTGTGIESGKLADVFNDFEQADASTTQKHGVLTQR